MKNMILIKTLIFLLLTSNFIQANSDIIAGVNGENITLKELEIATKTPSLTREKLILNKNAYLSYLNNMINDRLIKQLVIGKNLVPDYYIEKQLKILKFNTINNEFKKKLLSETTVSQKEIKKFYEENKSKMQSPAQYKVLFEVFKENSIETKDFINDVKNAKDRVSFLEKNGAIAKVITKKAFPDTYSYNEFKKIKKGQIENNLIKIGANYVLFYIVDIQKEKKLSLSDVAKNIEKILIKQKVAHEYDNLTKSLKKKATISISKKYEPTINGFTWDAETIRKNFIITGIAKNFKLVKKDTTLSAYLRISDEDRQKLIDIMINLPLIYDYAMETTFKNNKKIQEYFSEIPDKLKINYWLEEEIYSDKNLGKIYFEARMFSDMENAPIINTIDQLIARKKILIAKELRKQADIKIYIDEPYSNENKTIKRNIKTEDTIIKECIVFSEKNHELIQATNTTYEQAEKIYDYFSKCKKPYFSERKVKKACYKYYKKIFGRKLAKQKARKDDFCKNSF